jgi:hypothetical protein
LVKKIIKEDYNRENLGLLDGMTDNELYHLFYERTYNELNKLKSDIDSSIKRYRDSGYSDDNIENIFNVNLNRALSQVVYSTEKAVESYMSNIIGHISSKLASDEELQDTKDKEYIRDVRRRERNAGA